MPIEHQLSQTPSGSRQAPWPQALANRDRQQYWRSAMTSHDSASSGTLRVGAKDDFVLNTGSWFQVLDDEQLLVTCVIPPQVPMFRQVVDDN
jgi:hypothetical protein